MNACRLLLVTLFVMAGCGKSPIAPKSSEPVPDVYVKGSALVEGANIDVVNKDTFDWTNVELELNPPSGYKYHVDTFKGWSDQSIPASKFVNASGQAFDITKTKPQKFTVHCDTPQGKGFCEGEWD